MNILTQGKVRPQVLSSRPQVVPSRPLKVAQSSRKVLKVSKASALSIDEDTNFMKDFKENVREELKQRYETGEVNKTIVPESFNFSDPLLQTTTLDQFQTFLRTLRTVFDIQYNLFDVYGDTDDIVKTRWSKVLNLKFFSAVNPFIKISGTSQFVVDRESGKILSQVDVWDTLNGEKRSDQNSVQMQALFQILDQLRQVRLTAEGESPPFILIKKNRQYEIRQYESYGIAEVDMNSQQITAGYGFNDLFNYIAGGNEGSNKMEMTTPVVTKQDQNKVNTMQFPIEQKFVSEGQQLPKSTSAKVTTRMEQGKTVAVIQVDGLPLENDVKYAEQKLRAQLALDGLEGEQGYELFRYNEPFALPFVRRNELAIKLLNYKM